MSSDSFLLEPAVTSMRFWAEFAPPLVDSKPTFCRPRPPVVQLCGPIYIPDLYLEQVGVAVQINRSIENKAWQKELLFFLLSEKGNWNETDVLCCRRCSSSFPLVQFLPFISILWLPVLHACCRRLVVTMWWSPALLKTDAAFVTVTAPPVRQWGERLRRVKGSVCFWPFFLQW